ncbi:MAG: hypothetical protein RRZ69_00575 [Clostridia bacterium]
MNEFVGQKVDDVVTVLRSVGQAFKVVEYNDRKMANFDTKLVIKQELDGDVITLIVGNFLFRPIEKEKIL